MVQIYQEVQEVLVNQVFPLGLLHQVDLCHQGDHQFQELLVNQVDLLHPFDLFVLKDQEDLADQEVQVGLLFQVYQCHPAHPVLLGVLFGQPVQLGQEVQVHHDFQEARRSLEVQKVLQVHLIQWSLLDPPYQVNLEILEILCCQVDLSLHLLLSVQAFHLVQEHLVCQLLQAFQVVQVFQEDPSFLILPEDQLLLWHPLIPSVQSFQEVLAHQVHLHVLGFLAFPFPL